MNQRKLADLEPGERACLTVYILERRSTVTRDGAPYAEMTVCDRTGRMKARKWNLTDPEWDVLVNACFLDVVGRAREGWNAKPGAPLELAIESFQEATDQDPRDFLPQPRCDVHQEWNRFSTLVHNITEPDLARLLRAVFKDPERQRAYRDAPGAQSRHHAYPGGLLEHSVEVAELCLAVSERIDHLDGDLLVAGALLHDVGKIREMQVDIPGYAFTADGGLLGHVMLGADLIREATAGLEGFSEDTRNRLLHLILSHHGRREWGAPVEPATAEALLLHSCDQISVQMFYCRDAQRQPSNDLFVWAPSLERRLYMAPPVQTEAPAEPDGLPANPFSDEAFIIPGMDGGPPPLRILAGDLAGADSLPEMMVLPIYGSIAAGSAIRAEQNLEGFHAVSVTGRRDADDFLLRVTGESMRDAHILDGDLVRVRPHAEARDGDIVAALVNSEVTVKRLRRSPDGVVLEAENPEFADIPVGETDALEIQGVVVGLVRDHMG